MKFGCCYKKLSTKNIYKRNHKKHKDIGIDGGEKYTVTPKT